MLRLVKEGQNRYRVCTPFQFGDGDHLVIVLKSEQPGAWLFSDEGHTYMHLTYSLNEKDLQKGNRRAIIANALTNFGAVDRNGELIMPVCDGKFGHALYSFIQVLLKIFDVSARQKKA